MPSPPSAPFQQTLLQVFNEGRIDLADWLVQPDYIEHALPPGVPGGLPVLLSYLGYIRTAFPDLRLQVEDTVTEGGRIAMRISAAGTQLGSLHGQPATGRRAEWEEMHFFRLVDERISEHWVITSTFGMLRQLGLVAFRHPAESKEDNHF